MNPELKLTPEQQRIYDSVPADEPRSRLDPYRALILRWRGQRRTYRHIRQLLSEKFSVRVSTAMVHKFVQKHNRPRKPAQPDLEPQAGTLAPVTNESGQAVEPVRSKPRMSIEEQIARREAIRAAFDKPLFPTEEKKPLFVRRPGPILNLTNNNKEEG